MGEAIRQQESAAPAAHMHNSAAVADEHEVDDVDEKLYTVQLQKRACTRLRCTRLDIFHDGLNVQMLVLGSGCE